MSQLTGGVSDGPQEPIITAVRTSPQWYTPAILLDRTSSGSEGEPAIYLAATEPEKSLLNGTDEASQPSRRDRKHYQLPVLKAPGPIERNREATTVTTTDRPTVSADRRDGSRSAERRCRTRAHSKSSFLDAPARLSEFTTSREKFDRFASRSRRRSERKSSSQLLLTA